MGTISIIPNTVKDFNLIAFEIGNFYIESLCSNKINKIDRINTYDSTDGYTEFMCNGEEEYVCIKDNLNSLA